MNELDFIVKTAYGYIEDGEDRLEEFVGEDDFDRAFYYAMEKEKHCTNFPSIIDCLYKLTHISVAEAYEKGRSRCTREEAGRNYLTCEGYIAFVKEGKYRKSIGVMKNE